MNNFREKGIGFLSDSLAEGVERACDARNRGGIRQLLSQGSEGPIHFEIYYKEKANGQSRSVRTWSQNAIYR